jgi:ABC-type Mn2+/Zn2+ transport system permease subunit
VNFEESIRLFGSAFVAGLVVALACALLGVHVVARRLIAVGVALPQMAALGIACSFVFLGASEAHGAGDSWRHDAMALLLELIGAAILALGSRGRFGNDTLAGVLFAGSGALTILLMMRSAQGLDEVRNLVEGNILAVHEPELLRLTVAVAPVVLLHTLGGRRLLFCTFDRETAATLGIRAAGWEAAFFVSLAILVAAGVHATGTLFVFGFLVLPGAAGIALGRSAAGVFTTAVLLASASAALGFERSYAWDTPTGPTCVGVALVLFLLVAAVASLRARLMAK